MCCSSQVLKYPFHFLPMDLSRVIHISTHHSNYMWNVKPSANYSIHNAPSCTSIRNMWHMLPSFLICGDKALESLKWATNEVLTNFDPCIPKCSNTFSIYFFYDKYNLFASRYLLISILNIFFATPWPFISNLLKVEFSTCWC